MDIRHRLYPYPVLSDTTDDYIDSSYTMELQAVNGIRELRLTISLKLLNPKIQQMIEDGLAEYVIHIECSYTSYRTVIKTDETTIVKSIPEHKLNGMVTVCAFIVAKTDLPSYYNDHFNEDYGGMGFDLHKGNILAVGGQANIRVTKEVEELSKIPSIFTICRNAEDIDDCMKIDIYGEKIAITLCKRSFSNYKLLAGIPQMLPVLHTMLIIPTLIYTFEKLKAEGTGEFEELRWYKSIERALKKQDLTFDKELLELVPSFVLAQKSLDMPVDRALDALSALGMEDEES